MANLALITGASSGIGRELARIHAAKKGDLAITARREERLQDLKAELESAHKIKVHCFPLDITEEGAAQCLSEQMQAAGLEVEFLINNAGSGGNGRFLEQSLEHQLRMIDLNVSALVSLTHLIVPQMIARGRGRVLNVGSIAGLVPGPHQAIYFASKAFVNSFSQALDQEYRPLGITSTLLAPGLVETEFIEKADFRGTRVENASGRTASHTAKVGYEAMVHGKLFAYDRWHYQALFTFIAPFLPRRLQLQMVEREQGPMN